MMRHRYATREEVADLLVPYLDGLDERYQGGDYSNRDVALAVLDVLGEMSEGRVNALVKIAVRE